MSQRLLIARAPLSLLLSFQLALMPVFSTSAYASPTNTEDSQTSEPATPLDGFIREVEAANESTKAHPLDNFGLIGQTRIETSAETGQVLREVPLNNYQIANADVPIPEFMDRLKIEANPAQSALQVSIASGKPEIIYTQKIPNVHLTAAPSDVLIRDANFALMSTDKGIEAVFLPTLQPWFLRSSIPRFLVSPSADKIAPGARFIKLEFAKADETSPREVFDKDGNKLRRVLNNDVLATVQLADGTTKQVRIDYAEDILVAAGNQMTHFFLQIMAANPDTDPKILKEFLDLVRAPDIQEDMKKMNDLKESLLNNDERLKNGSDLLQAALANVAQRSNMGDILKFVKRDQYDRNLFAQEATKNRDMVSLRPLAADWDSQVVEAANHPAPDVLKTIKVGDDLGRRVRISHADKVLKFARRMINPTLVVSLVAAVGLDATGSTPWLLSVLSHVYDGIVSVPYGPGYLTDAVLGSSVKAAAASKFFETNFAMTKWAVGLAFFVSMVPFSYVFAKGWYDLQKKNWSEVKSFFTLGLRFCARVNYPFQRIGYLLARQKNVYPAVVDRLPLNTAGLFNSPLANQADLEVKQKQIDEAVQSNAVQKSRALLIAAAMVSQQAANSAEPMDPVLLLELFSANQLGKLPELMQSWADPKNDDQTYLDLLPKMITALKMETDPKASAISRDEVIEFRDELDGLRKRYYAMASSGAIGDARIKVARLWRRMASTTSKDILPYILFGSNGYEAYRKYRYAEIDQRNAETAAVQYETDYPSGALLMAIAFPQGFGGWFGQFDNFIKASVVQTEQIFSYGGSNGYDNVVTHDGQQRIADFAPQVNQAINRGEAPKKGSSSGAGRQMSAWGTLKVIANATFNPVSENSWQWLRSEERALQATVDTLQMRVLSTVGPWAIGFASIAAKHAIDNHENVALAILTGTATAVMIKVDIWLTKNIISNTGIGYATIWPWVRAVMNGVKDKVAVNRNHLQTADYLIHTGLKFDDREMMTDGIVKMQELFAQGKTELSEALKVPVTNETEQAKVRELADGISKYSIAHPPVETVQNNGFDKWVVNLRGSILSTLIFAKFFVDVSDHGLLWQTANLLEGLGYFGATLLGAKAVLAPIDAYVAARKKKKASESCQESLLRSRAYNMTETLPQ